MRSTRSIPVRAAAVAALGALALAVAAPPAGARTLKVKSGTTTLTFGGPAIQALTAMGISFAPVAPAGAAGATLSFPVRPGTLKVTGSAHKNVTGRIAQRGGMTLSNQVLKVGLSNPVIRLAGSRSVLDTTSTIGTAPPLRITMATLDLSHAKTSVTAKRLRIRGLHVELTSLAASAMNAGFGVSGFTPGFEIGTATVNAALKH